MSPRFIPTPVGNATRLWCSTPRTAVHPHARGERKIKAGIYYVVAFDHTDTYNAVVKDKVTT